jgi:hypothetical protein
MTACSTTMGERKPIVVWQTITYAIFVKNGKTHIIITLKFSIFNKSNAALKMFAL